MTAPQTIDRLTSLIRTVLGAALLGSASVPAGAGQGVEILEGTCARHIAAARGYIAEWHLLGPFANDERNSGLRTVHPPERGVDLDANRSLAQHRQRLPPANLNQLALVRAINDP